MKKPRLSPRRSRQLLIASLGLALLLLIAGWLLAPPPADVSPADIGSLTITVPDSDAAPSAPEPLSPRAVACVICLLLAAGSLVLGYVQAFFFYRCPRCQGSLLWVRGLLPTFCPHCGEPL
ncbi:MAG TPA: hypothetical protein H9699_05810 [Candidatus Gemmiger stercoravium]|nr:hypothetical protein [Candidatus Gemmiger stercoravium]